MGREYLGIRCRNQNGIDTSGGWKTEIARIGRYCMESTCSERRACAARLGSGVRGGIEKSSDTDSPGSSDVRTSMSVTDAPSICDTTQMHTNRTKITTPVPQDEEANDLVLNRLIEFIILSPGMVGK